MKILENPVALPGKCACCGASDNDDGRKYVDIGFELDFYGVVYFCTHCLSEIAAAVGYVAPSLFKVVEEENFELANKVSGLSAENVKLRVALDHLDFLGTGSDSDVSTTVVEESTEPKRPVDPKPAKPVDESGHTNVPKTRKSSKSTTTADFDDFLE